MNGLTDYCCVKFINGSGLSSLSFADDITLLALQHSVLKTFMSVSTKMVSNGDNESIIPRAESFHLSNTSQHFESMKTG